MSDLEPGKSAQLFEKILSTSESFRDYINKSAKEIKVKRGTILQYEGSIANKAYYVKKGLLRSYLIDQKGKTHIFMFAPEGWAINDVESNTFSQPSDLYIDALEDSEVIEINIAKVRSMELKNEILQGEIKQLLIRLSVLQRRVIMLLSFSARERYEHFIMTYPNLFNRVSLKMIASFLGMTPEALSKIRRQVRDNG